MAPPQVDLPDEAGWSTVSSGPLHVLVRAGGALVDRVRTAAQDGDLDEVLDALTRDGVRATPEFVAVLEGEPARVVARGCAYAVVSGPGGESAVRAAGRGPWTDEDAAEGAERIVLHTGATAAASAPRPEREPDPVPHPEPHHEPQADPEPPVILPADPVVPVESPTPAAPTAAAPAAPSPSPASGPAPQATTPPSPETSGQEPSGWRMPNLFGRVKEPAAESPAAAPPTAPSPAPSAPAPEVAAPAGPTADDVEELPSYDHLFGATQHERPGYIEQHDTQNIKEPPIGHAPIESAGGFNPAEAPTPADHTLAPPTDTVHPQPGRQVTPAPGPVAPAPVVPAKGGLIDSVPWRSGGSNVPAPDPAPARPATGSRTPPPAPSLRPATPTVPPAPAPPAPAPPVPVRPATGPLVSPPPSTPPASPAAPPAPRAAPPASPAAPPAPPAAPPVAASPAPPSAAYPPPSPPGAPAPFAPGGAEASDEAEATVDRSALLGARQPAPAGPTVLAVLCPAGHTSPPHSASCRQCGRDIPAQQPFPTPRPSLGVLRLQTGDVVQLDRGVLLGRSPKVNAELAAADRPHLVRVTSAQNDISRNHVEIVLEGWHVLIRDLESTNGTTIALPGQLPVRLRPSDQQVLEPGTVITLADEVSLTYEVGA